MKTNRFIKLRDQKGESLIMVMVATAVGLIVASAMATLMVGQARQVGRLERVIESDQLRMSLMQSLNPNRSVPGAGGAPDNLCDCLLNADKNVSQSGKLQMSSSSLNSASDQTPASFNLNGITRDCTAGSTKLIDLSNGPQSIGKLKVNSVKFEVTEPVADTSVAKSVKGRWVVGFENSSQEMPLAPLFIDQYVNLEPALDGANPGAMRVGQCLGSAPLDQQKNSCGIITQQNFASCFDGKEAFLKDGSVSGFLCTSSWLSAGTGVKDQTKISLQKNADNGLDVYIQNQPTGGSRSSSTCGGWGLSTAKTKLCTISVKTGSCIYSIGGGNGYYGGASTMYFRVSASSAGIRIEKDCTTAFNLTPTSGYGCVQVGQTTSDPFIK